MKTIAILFSLFLCQIAFAQTETTGNIVVSVENLSSEEGKVYFALFNEDNFLKKAPIQGEVSEIKEGVAQITFSEVPSGTYAVTAYHDKNGNQQMDFESNGIPKENYGVSNNQMNLYGPPLWEDAKFEFDGSDKALQLQF
ncbi:DUF2141 domain-containing protein [Salegentibacter mishustinae]|jgi:uncharacterized protein (DUF2141 family)|uniref:DUF2141 domain-containing protein n=1 Tax=Salegentibacter mishustinae TaxID=270918 RepID=A0A0Q9ZM05_9FLAO|nr:DUF2141 domain-containing protein [Salegentibacter mishustinae]KRG30196.1 hypothetical protein APR42_13505 [Salegentibacter mishustinae]PNW19422.1 hypothetical protein APB85_16095 [Salegentibacter mishustinae]PZX62133.1 uncharacterized protein (DUF2141 family) [Salegentibacter mishustinae]GGW94231.1 hypothetical protein GCM10008086_23990 [Salegentibacter mishustinae]|tara:strand:- start:208 stop:627 length:420 start_codon:yes stop_codon:yes gene_type:complete